MSLRIKAGEILQKISRIQTLAAQINELCQMILMQKQLNGDVIELTDETKQKIIQHYETKKTQLQKLIGELP